MGFIVEPSGEDKLTLLITPREGFVVTVHADGTIAITGPKDAMSLLFFGSVKGTR